MINDSKYEQQLSDYAQGFLDGLKESPDYHAMSKAKKQEAILEGVQKYKEFLARVETIRDMNNKLGLNSQFPTLLNSILESKL